MIASAAALTSCRARSVGPAIESSTPFAPSIEDSSSGEEIAAFAASSARSSPEPMPDAHQRGSGARHHRLHVGEVEVDQPGRRDQRRDAVDALDRGPGRPSGTRRPSASWVGDLEQPVVRHDDQRVDGLLQLGDPDVGLGRALAPLEAERPRDDADRQRARGSRAISATMGAPPVPVPPPSPAVMNTMSAPLRISSISSACSLGGALADLRIGAGAEPAGGLPADVELHFRVGHQQGLGVGVDGDELDAPEACLDHPVHRVHAASADADDLDDGEVVLGSVHRSSSPPGDRCGHRPGRTSEDARGRMRSVPLRHVSCIVLFPYVSPRWPSAASRSATNTNAQLDSDCHIYLQSRS